MGSPRSPTSSDSASVAQSRRSVSMISSPEDAEIFGQMTSSTSVRLKKPRKDGNREELPPVSPTSHHVEELVKGINAVALTLLQSLSPTSHECARSADQMNEDEDVGLWNFVEANDRKKGVCSTFGADSVASFNRTHLDLHHNDNTFHVLANLLVEFMEGKLSQDQETIILHPEDRIRLERVLPESIRLDFIDAVRFRLGRNPSTPTTPLQHLTMQCQKLGFDREGRRNPILVAANMEDEISFIPLPEGSGKAEDASETLSPVGSMSFEVPTARVAARKSLDEIVFSRASSERARRDAPEDDDDYELVDETSGGADEDETEDVNHDDEEDESTGDDSAGPEASETGDVDTEADNTWQIQQTTPHCAFNQMAPELDIKSEPDTEPRSPPPDVVFLGRDPTASADKEDNATPVPSSSLSRFWNWSNEQNAPSPKPDAQPQQGTAWSWSSQPNQEPEQSSMSQAHTSINVNSFDGLNINPFSALASAAHPFAASGFEPSPSHIHFERLERQRREIQLRTQTSIDTFSVVSEQIDTEALQTGPEALARQQLLAELREATNLMNDSENPETAKFWKDHVLDLQNRLRVLNGEESDPTIRPAVAEQNRILVSEIEKREQYLPPSPTPNMMPPRAPSPLRAIHGTANQVDLFGYSPSGILHSNGTSEGTGTVPVSVIDIGTSPQQVEGEHPAQIVHSQPHQTPMMAYAAFPASEVPEASASLVPPASPIPMALIPGSNNSPVTSTSAVQPATAPTPSPSPVPNAASSSPVQKAPMMPPMYEMPMVDVVAPADLPGGYHFEAEIEGKRFLATVPAGGVQQGETFTCYMRELDSVAIDIPVGYWKDGAANICEYGCCHPVIWHSIFCPLGKSHCSSDPMNICS